MPNLVIINLGKGNLYNGFSTITVQLWLTNQQRPEKFIAKLPPAANLAESYREWKLMYQALCNRQVIRTSLEEDDDLEIIEGGINQISQVSFEQLNQTLQKHLNSWLKSEDFLPIDLELRSQLNQKEDIQVIFETNDEELWQFPWYGWNFFKDYPHSEMALSRQAYQRQPPQKTQRKKVRILAILGNTQGIDVEQESSLLNQLEDAETKFLVKPSHAQLNAQLKDKQGWDVLFFAGHSQTTGATGRIYINENKGDNYLRIEQLEESLKPAIENGLRVAIFNSCDGVGLALALEKLRISLVIVMREPVPNRVAEEFFKHFLEAFSEQRQPLYQAFREARSKLQDLENEYPGASWLPVICQNPSVDPPTWLQLGGIPPCPYKGLETFQPKDHKLFFGREKTEEKITTALKRQSLVAVVGASGSGKSSVVLAGIGRLLDQDKGKTKLAVFRPKKNPFPELASALEPLFRSQHNETLSQTNRRLVQLATQVELEQHIRNNPQALREKVVEFAQIYPDTNFLLVVDQFEELYTQNIPKEDVQAFLDVLIYAVEPACSFFTLILTLRGDFYGAALAYRPFSDILEDRVINLGPMNSQELQLAIEQPARLRGIKLEPALTNKLIEAVDKQPGSLPLLEFTLEQLWQKQKNGMLTHKAYDQEIGGLETALVRHADQSYAKLISTGEKSKISKQIQEIFIHLVSMGEDGKPTRRIATRGEIGEEGWKLVTQLADTRLVITNQNHSTKEETVEVTHEALLSAWPTLMDWIREDREFLLWRGRTKQDLSKWHKQGESSNYLLTGGALVEAEKWLPQVNDEWLLMQRFIQKSIEVRDLRKKQIRKARQLTLGGAISAAIILAGVAGVAFFQNKLATLGIKVATVQNLLPTADATEGLILAIDNLQKSRTFNRHLFISSQANLFQAVQEARERNIFIGHSDEVTSVAISPDGQRIISVSKDGTLRLWDLKGNPIGKPFRGDKGEVWSVAFSPDGQRIISGSLNGTLQLWDLKGNPIGKPFQGHKSRIWSVAFSPDSKLIVSANGGEQLRLWDFNGNPIGKPFCCHPQGHDFPFSVAFSPDGQRIVSGHLDGTVRLWDLKGNPIGEPFRGHEKEVWSVAFSPDRQRIVSGSNDRKLKLWDLKGNQIASFRAHDAGGVKSVAFSPDGQRIVSGSWDSTIRLWDLKGNPIGEPFQGHNGPVLSVAWNPDGQHIISSSSDKTLRIWDVDDDLSKSFQGHDGQIFSVAFTPDGLNIITGGEDGMVRMWDLNGNQVSKPFIADKKGVKSIDISPNGKFIVTGGEDSIVRLWDLNGNPVGKPFLGHQIGRPFQDVDCRGVSSVVFSPDSKQIASGSSDGTVRLWDLQGDRLHPPFQIATEFQVYNKSLQSYKHLICSVVFSPDGQFIAVASEDKTIGIWDLKGDPVSKTFKGHSSAVRSVKFSPDGQLLLSGSSDKTLRLWDLEGNPIGEPFQGHSGGVLSVAFSQDGKRIISGSWDGTVRLWDLKGKQIGSFLHKNGMRMNSVAFSPDGRHIVSGSKDGTVTLWLASWQDWMQIACERLSNHYIFRKSGEQPYVNPGIVRGAKKACQQNQKRF
ncbi:eIF2A-related protein [Calothrix rhizosoleniae]|uniref:nSTAND1 domain-containing NTPase n=1 Tax=Calothrix rhizosoleniae TaxID=888997 RepID=UPI000B49992A|nr:CHAT domain-containing protein [Calothrix rhizosoleniae]